MLLRRSKLLYRAAVLVVAFIFPFLWTTQGVNASFYTNYTSAQRTNTRIFLQAFVNTNPRLQTLPAVDFCEWIYVSCTSKGVDVYLDEAAVVQLPELPAAAVGNHVMVTLISVSYGTETLRGTLPASWARLSRIEYISLFSNSLTGTLPPEWSNMKTLKWFLLYENQLTGTIPESWSRLRFMTWVCLNENRLTGSLPPSWGTASRLTIIEAKNNKLSGTLPSEWSSLQRISSITLSNNRLTGPLPDTWASAPTLNGVSVNGNSLCGCVPSTWANHEFIYGIYVDPAVASANCSTANACP
ncbi:uncharacterized protein JKF63_08013 [Porcisia hertigi]|uniref:Uncharacterized protein n=1 Tax=Porcisia hertigi TaxID=2761500 RepID=A0A836I4M1_9TRYP|nr:hypothetical protein JKF63_08013 [Porcisia hertigi]